MEKGQGCKYKYFSKSCGMDIYKNNLCIFHSEDKDKDSDYRFSYLIDEKIKANDFDFEGYIFPEGWHIYNFVFEKAIFKNAIFLGHVNFMGKFRDKTNFEDAKFVKGATFFEVEFPDSVYFSGAEFFGDADFNKVKFTGGAEFFMTRFTGMASFEAAEFINGANFCSAEFTREANFVEAKFADVKAFNEEEFTEQWDFDEAKSTSQLDFYEEEFAGNMDYDEQELIVSANFDGAKFLSGANFWRASFDCEADFGMTDFGDAASADMQRLEKTINFSKVVFYRKVNFKFSSFYCRGLFGNTTFAGEADFERCRFLGPETLFWDTEFFTITRFDDAILNNVTFKGRNTNLQCVTFLDSKIDKVDFRYPIFRDGQSFVILPLINKKIHIMRRGNLLYDEEIGNRDPMKVKRLYLDLKKNAEEMRDYQLAGDFHIGEMEMALKTEDSWLRRQFIRGYKLFSGYGEHYPLALAWNLFFAFFIFPIIYMITGIEYIGNITNNLIHGLIYSLQTYVPIPRFSIYKPADNFWSITFTVIESILGPILITLFLLALRRRFKR